MREVEIGPEQTCPFCREPLPETDEEMDKQRMKRIEANDPVAMVQEGGEQHKKGNYSEAVEYLTKAAELGSLDAHCKLSDVYHYGLGVERDLGKVFHHLEEATIGGHPDAKHNLGCQEEI